MRRRLSHERIEQVKRGVTHIANPLVTPGLKILLRMIEREWHFRLEGDELDVNTIAELFCAEVQLVKDANGRNELVMGLWFAHDQSLDAEKVAEEWIAKLNAIAQVIHGNAQNVQIGGIACKDPSTGAMKYFIRAKAGMVRFRGGMPTIGNSGDPDPLATAPRKIGDEMLVAADKARSGRD